MPRKNKKYRAVPLGPDAQSLTNEEIMQLLPSHILFRQHKTLEEAGINPPPMDPAIQKNYEDMLQSSEDMFQGMEDVDFSFLEDYDENQEPKTCCSSLEESLPYADKSSELVQAAPMMDSTLDDFEKNEPEKEEALLAQVETVAKIPSRHNTSFFTAEEQMPVDDFDSSDDE